MSKNKRKGFTLIELIAVLVILAILALIVTPLVMNIIRKARISADKRSIDAYGRSVEYAIATYLLDNGKFPTSIEELTIEYTGDEVVCSTSKLNSDSSVYLAGCTVGGRSVDYTYGNEESIVYDAYQKGDTVTYNGMNFHVIKDSGTSQDYVTLLLDTPLTATEVNTYGGVGTANNHVNKYVTSNTSASYYQKAYDYNSAGYLAFYSRETCGYDSNNNWVTTGCNNNYADSDIKYVVDAWALDKTTSSDLKEIDGYKARMITYDELTDELGYEKASSGTIMPSSNGDTPNWVWNSGNNAGYWTMSGVADSTDRAWFVLGNDGGLSSSHVINDSFSGSVRPVINLLKSAI